VNTTAWVRIGLPEVDESLNITTYRISTMRQASNLLDIWPVVESTGSGVIKHG
jgi:hypothetical protein